MQYRHSVVAHFASLKDAKVAKTKLEIDGIDSEIVLDRDDEGGPNSVLLTVDEADLMTAQRLLVDEVDANQRETYSDAEDEPFESLSKAEEEAIQHAAGLNFGKRFLMIVALLMAMLLAVQYFGIR